MNVPRWPWPAVAVSVAAAAIFLSGRDVKTPDGGTLIQNVSMYQEANSKVRALTFPAFVAADKGEEITPAMKADLEKAIPLLNEMNRYAPVKVGSYFALGKTQMLLGRLPEGGRGLEQAILNQSADQEEKDTPVLKETVIEAKCLLSELMLELAVQKLKDAAGTPESSQKAAQQEVRKIQERAVSWAAEAVQGQPQSPRNWAALASGYLAIHRDGEAKKAVQMAASLDPNHFKVKPLVALVNSGG